MIFLPNYHKILTGIVSLGRLMRENRIRNEHVRGSIGVTLIVNKVRENRLRWFGNVMKR